MTAAAPERRRAAARPLVGSIAGLVAAAGLMWGAVAAWSGGAPSWPTGVAWLALAGVAGVVAGAGVARRLIGGLLGLAGIAALVGAVVALAGGGGAGPWLAVAGAAVLVVVGAFVAVREPRMARFGARYARGPAPPADPDRAAWQELDAGRDPTVGPAAPTGGEG